MMYIKDNGEVNYLYLNCLRLFGPGSLSQLAKGGPLEPLKYQDKELTWAKNGPLEKKAVLQIGNYAGIKDDILCGNQTPTHITQEKKKEEKNHVFS